jgi:GNAT superfamily N-acetyltransferase
MSEWPTFIDPRDLAPGDLVPHPDLPDGIELCRIESADDHLFESAYRMLQAEFGHANEIESRDVLIDRLGWRVDRENECGFAMAYELLALKVAGEMAAVRDHSAIISRSAVTVHMSHVLVSPNWRRRGLATILRTLPVGFARRAAALAGVSHPFLTLFCEMDPVTPGSHTSKVRRVSYEKAGFLAIPAGHSYLQPDFRESTVIGSDPEGPKPVALDLLFRRIGKEHEMEMSAAELIEHIERIYAMYQRNIAPAHMAACFEWLEAFRATATKTYPLIPPASFP